MGLPQELVDLIIGALHDDLPTLKSCSLTCKSMFVSTRRLIHQILYLTPRNNERILTKGETMKLNKGGRDKVPQLLRILSYMGERGYLRYTRQVYISDRNGFVPKALGYHFRHFESLVEVHTLTIEFFDVIRWAPYFKRCFLQFYPTVTSLALRASSGHYRLLLEFALQFPNLDNLSLECPEEQELIPPDLELPGIATSPPLRGHLRLTGATADALCLWLIDLAYVLPNGINFRSIELEDISGHQVQHVVDACGRTLENLILIPYQHGMRFLSIRPSQRND